MIIEVIPEVKSFKLDTFSYLVPKELEPNIKVGQIVVVPFGKKKIRGTVKQVKGKRGKVKDSQNFQIKNIISVDPSFIIHDSYFNIIDWIAEHYLCTQGEALSLFLPPEMKRIPKFTPNAEEIRLENHKKLSDSQNIIFQEIVKSGNNKPHLIYGVTGSGKTEIYIKLCIETIKKGKSCIVLVPEIILTPQNIERFEKVFGDSVALIHSNLSQGEKYRAYFGFLNGDKKIIIGPRSALLIPNPNIGLIIIDEEHEDSYKQDQSPRYHAVDLAEQIAKTFAATLVLGSATPRIESYYKANQGEYILHKLETRFNKLILPPAEIVDLRDEIKKGNNLSISEKLKSALEVVLHNKKQAILFLNRRGSSTFVSCRECGEVSLCPNCLIPLVHYANNREEILFCHHCGHRTAPPEKCPVCASIKIKFFGAGVEKVEKELIKIFPKANIFRADSSTIKNKNDHRRFYSDFIKKKFDIVIGTQMITKGFDMPEVDLVGIISADTGLHLPYFRASEKIFRLLTQVSGRSGRSNNVGKTIIQTYWPGSKAITEAVKHDFVSFYQSEIINREKHGYPPFSNLLRIVSEHEKPEKAKAQLDKILPELDQLNLEYIGPGPCFFQRLRGKWRYHIIIKLPNNLINDQDTRHKISPEGRPCGQSNPKLQNPNDEIKITNPLRGLWKNNLNLIWDVDPQDLL